MIPEVIASRSNLIRFLSNDSQFEFEKTYSYNKVLFGPVSNRLVWIEFPDGSTKEKRLNDIDDRWLTMFCNKAKKDLVKKREVKKATKATRRILAKNKIEQSGRIKPDVIKDPAYMKWVATDLMPRCFICGGFCGIELHHIKEFSSDKKNDKRVIPLCGESCHRIGKIMSAHGTPVKFRLEYPIKMQVHYADTMYSIYENKDK